MDRRSAAPTGAGSRETAQENNPFFERRQRAASDTPRASTAWNAPARSVAPRASAAVNPARSEWGWLPAIFLMSAFGLVSVGAAMTLALDERPAAQWFLWLGLLLIFMPVAFRMGMPQVARRERIALAVWLGLALYLVKILRSPLGFTFHDEFPHYSTAEMILRTRHLFSQNSLQGVSAYFPGLEVVTAALVSVSGLSIEAAGIIVIGVARLIASLAVYLLFEEISGSSRVAGVGSVLAIAYPNYIFWSAQYAYESLALPLSILVIVVGLLNSRVRSSRTGLTAIAFLLVAAVVITHHFASYFLAAAIAAVWLFTRFGAPLLARVEPLVRRAPRVFARLTPETFWLRPTGRATRPEDWKSLMVVSVTLSALWLALGGGKVVDYVKPHLIRAAEGLIGLFVREAVPRQPFSSSAAATTAAPWEQLVAFAAVFLILLVIPFGLIQIWRRYRRHGVALLFAVAAIAYPFTLALRLAGGGAEIANRSWDFLFIGLAFVLATGITELWMRNSRPAARAGMFAVYASILLIGALIVGTPAWARLPGPFLVGGDTRGLQPESYALTDWMRETVGPGHRILADYSNKLLLGSFGQQYSVTGESWIFMSDDMGETAELASLIERGVQYVVVDDRLATQTPRIGHYIEPGEPGSSWSEPIPAEWLAKFNHTPCLSRVFDSGHIAVYAVAPGCAPGDSATLASGAAAGSEQP